ncbi:MAG TPA: site-2 protease family protein [Dongiaceae bacterium]|nr:site-2 protease family protein [Dongiaceae bacterium]
MPADISAFIQTVAIIAIPIIIAITFHEAAHGFVAWRLGDDTAHRLGRVTFNPLKHIDPIGTIILPAVLYLSTGFMFGYAKPVPVNYRRLRRPRRDMVLVAAAGPGINFLLAIASAILLHFVPVEGSVLVQTIGHILVVSVAVNVLLAVFNMLPLPPLDGGRVAVGLLPYPLSLYLARTERYGMMILILALIILPWIGSQLGMDLGIVGWIIGPIADHIQSFIYWITGNGPV